MLRKEAHKALIGWEAKGPTHMTASFMTRNKYIKMNVVLGYAPTNDSSEDDKDSFYSQLSGILEKLRNRDINIIMGNFNTKIGKDNRGFEQVMEQYGLEEMNENGERFADTCVSNNLVIGGSIYQHKRILQATWISPDHVTENQTDHICISKRFRQSLLDV